MTALTILRLVFLGVTAFLLSSFLVSCYRPVLVQPVIGGTVSPERKTWEERISALVNAHEARLTALESPTPLTTPPEPVVLEGDRP